MSTWIERWAYKERVREKAPEMLALLAETHTAHSEKHGCGCSRFCQPYRALLREIEEAN